MQTYTIFEVTDYKTKEMFEHPVLGYGQEAIKSLRKEYPRHSKFVLLGFETNGTFKPIRL